MEEIKHLFPDTDRLPQYALRWILMFPEVSCVIPGASSAKQAAENAGASSMPSIDPGQMERIRRIYERLIKPLVHQRW